MIINQRYGYEDSLHDPPDQYQNETNEQQYTYINGLGFLPENPQLMERRRLSIVYNIILFSILLLFFLRISATMPVINVLSIFQKDIIVNRMTGYVTISEQAGQIVNMVVYAIYMLVPALVILFFCRKQVHPKQLFQIPNKGTILYGIGIIVGVSVLSQGIVYAFRLMLRQGGIGFFSTFDAPTTSIPGLILTILSMTILPACLEEFLFRGVLLHALRRFGDIIAVFVSTVLFALIQQRADTMVYAAVMGFVLGYFTLKTGGIVIPMIGNLLSKCLITGIWLISTTMGAYQTTAIVLLSFLLLIALFILLFVLFLKKDPHAFELYHEDTHLTNRTKVKMMLSNFGFWLICILAFLNIWDRFQFFG